MLPPLSIPHLYDRDPHSMCLAFWDKHSGSLFFRCIPFPPVEVRATLFSSAPGNLNPAPHSGRIDHPGASETGTEKDGDVDHLLNSLCYSTFFRRQALPDGTLRLSYGAFASALPLRLITSHLPFSFSIVSRTLESFGAWL